MRLGDLVDRQYTIDDRTQTAGLYMLDDLVQLGEATHRGAENRKQFEENEADVDRRFAARGRAAGDQPAAACQSLQRSLERVRSNVFEHDVHAAFPGQSAHGANEIRFAVENRFVSAEVLGALRFFRAADGGV